jgi:hypothetical protein
VSVVFYVEDHVGDLGWEHFGFPFWKIWVILGVRR